jgi:hypothetical protein
METTTEFKKIRWCETHNNQHMLKDACYARMAAMAMGNSGAVNLGEQMDGLKDCVEGDRWVTTEDPDGS